MSGRTDFLVYGECVCGWSMAALEGSRWPNCPVCDAQVMPPRPHGELQRFGYLAEMRPEQEAARDPRRGTNTAYDAERLYDADALTADSEARSAEYLERMGSVG